MEFDELLKEVLKENTLTEKDKVAVRRKVKGVVKQLKEELKKQKIKAEVMLGGSAAKDTFLKDFDVDIFVRFDIKKYINEDISKILEGLLKILKVKKVHGSRDYYQANIEGIYYEFVPVLNIEEPEQAVNVTDASPLHVQWVLDHLNERRRNDILLLKLFCKAIGCYGAESYIKGFSGHVLDILVIYYDGFPGVLKASQRWKEYQILDVSNHKVRFMNKSKLSPLIIVDPIDPGRNAAAALSMEQLKLFKEKAKELWEKPSKEFFVKKEFDVDKIRKENEAKSDEDKAKSDESKKNDVIVLNITAKSGKEDVVGSKLLKVFEFVSMRISKEGFELLKQDWKWNKAKKAEMYFVVKKAKLDEKMVVEGPPKFVKDHAAAFKKKHKDVFIEKGRLFANVKRPFRTAKKLVEALIEDEYVVDRVNKVTVE